VSEYFVDAGLIGPAADRNTPDHCRIVGKRRTGIVVYAVAPTARYSFSRTVGHWLELRCQRKLR
jgi:hypothetical protein